MRLLILLLLIACGYRLGHAADGVEYIRLDSKFNHKLSENMGRGFEGNHLKELPRGEQTFAKSKFYVGDGLMQLGSKILSNKPDKIEGISVARNAKKLHFLHATNFGGGPNTETDELFVKDGTLIGEYLVRYQDQSAEGVPIIYGETVRDWWFRPDEKDVKNGAVAWVGDCPWANENQCRVRLYVTTWTNPKPAMKIATIDFVGRKNEGVAAPFCLAITAED